MGRRGHSLVGCALFVCGCVESPPEPGGGPGSVGEETGLAILAVVDADTEIDVTHVRYEITRVACAEGEVFEPFASDIRVELVPFELPGGIPGQENAPFDAGSGHKFADHFQVLLAGCYDVTATPLAADTSESTDCAAARNNGVQVLDGITTEIMMHSQCKGPEIGAIDAVVAFNQPPQLVDLTFTPSKFIQAGGSTTVCATATDPNGDPLEFEWDQIGGSMAGDEILAPDQTPQPENPDSTTQCAVISPDEAGDYLFEVRIYDLLRDENNGLVRFETYLAQSGSPNVSNDSLRFPVHAGTAATTEPEEPGEPGEPGQP